MLSRNNRAMELRRENERNRFSIRKLSIGAASVLIGCVFYLGSSNTVQAADADTTNPADQTEVVEQKSDDQKAEDVKSEAQSDQKDSAVTNDQAADSEKEAPAATEIKKDAEAQGNQEETEQENDQKQDEAKDPAADNKDLKSIEDQVKNNASYQKDGEQSLDPDTVKGARILPQVAIQGEVPNLDAKAFVNQDMIDALNNLGVDLLADDPTSVKLSWVQAPDVSKLGQTTGKMKVEYATSRNDDNNPTYSSFVIDVPVDVVAGEKKTEDQVRNTLNFIDADTNEVRYHYTWTGKKGTDYQDPDNTVLPIEENGELDKILNSIEGLGFTLDEDETHTAINDASYFMDHDITRAVMITVGSKDENGKPKVVVEDPQNPVPNANYILQGSAYDYFSDPDHQDPAEFLYGLGYLDQTDNVQWGVAPEYKSIYDPETGNYDHGELENTPTIEIVDKDGKVLQTLSGEALNNALLYNYDKFNNGVFLGSPTVTGKVTIQENGEIPAASSVITNLPSADPESMKPDAKDLQAKLAKYYNVAWRIAPNVNQVGYQIAYIKFSLKDGVDPSEEDDAQNTLMAFFAENGGTDFGNTDPSSLTANPYAVLVQVTPKPATPVQPTTPSNPSNPTNPTQPTTDVQPTAPQPTTPVQPTDAQPTNAPVHPQDVTPAKKSNKSKTSENTRPIAETAKHNAKKNSAKAAPIKLAAKNGKTVTAAANKNVANNEVELPQTGEKQSATAFLGLAIAALAGLLGIAADKKRN